VTVLRLVTRRFDLTRRCKGSLYCHCLFRISS